MKKKLTELEINDKVWCDGDSSFCTVSKETIRKVTYQFDEQSGEKYKVLWIDESRKFDSRDGSAMSPPTAYYLTELESYD